MAQDSQQTPLLDAGEQEPLEEKVLVPLRDTEIRAAKCCGISCCVIFLVVWIVQAACYWYGLNFACNASRLEGYSYPGAEAGETFTKEANLLPRIALLAERDPSRYGSSFDVIPSNEASSIDGATVGVWWATWGPLFTTYTYEDVQASETIVYMRRNMLRLGMSHRIGRCDGKGADFTLTEGTEWLSNRVRHIFGINQAFTFELYDGDNFVGLVKETNKGTPSLTVTDNAGVQLGSGVMHKRNFHGDKYLWLAKTRPAASIPFYVTNSITVLLAFHTRHSKVQEAHDTYAARARLLLFANGGGSIFANESKLASEILAEDTLELNTM